MPTTIQIIWLVTVRAQNYVSLHASMIMLSSIIHLHNTLTLKEALHVHTCNSGKTNTQHTS